MTNLMLIVEELDSASIRKTDDGRYSVYDAIVLCGAKNPRATFDRLVAVYPEYAIVLKPDDGKIPIVLKPDDGKIPIVLKPDDGKIPIVLKPDDGKIGLFRFSRKDGKPNPHFTPVATKQVILAIIGLLPGKMGKAYREAAANLVVRYIENDVSLVTEQIERMTDIDDLNFVKEVTERRIDKVNGILVEAGLRKPSVRRKLKAVFEDIKQNHRQLVTREKQMVYISDFLKFTDDETTIALEPLLEMQGHLLIKAVGSMVSVASENFDQFRDRRGKEEGRILMHDELGKFSDPSDCFSTFFRD
jgi:hypothetical protein